MPAEQLCRKPPCVAPRKCWQFDYCWFYGDPPENDFFEADEPVEELLAAFDEGEKGVTAHLTTQDPSA